MQSLQRRKTSIKIKARNESITQSFIGKITVEGHKAIDYIGHQMNPFAVKRVSAVLQNTDIYVAVMAMTKL